MNSHESQWHADGAWHNRRKGEGHPGFAYFGQGIRAQTNGRRGSCQWGDGHEYDIAITTPYNGVEMKSPPCDDAKRGSDGGHIHGHGVIGCTCTLASQCVRIYIADLAL